MFIISSLILLGFVQTAYTCEGPCIDGLVKALVGNYSSTAVNPLFSSLAEEIAQQTLASRSTSDASQILQPVLEGFQQNASASMRAAEFPGFFHGKCQVNGVDPKGCPNPDCPVVCGTPGSIIHFYSTFVGIAYNTTMSGIVNTTSPHVADSQFAAIRQKVIAANQGKANRRALYPMPRRQLFDLFGDNLSGGSSGNDQERIDRALVQILGQDNIQSILQRLCGGSDLPNCDWIKMGMKNYILSFP